MANLGKNRKGKERKRKLDSRGGGEERVLQDRLRKATEADYRRRLALQVAAELKGRMMRENAARKLNSHRIHQQWLKIMRLTKLEQLRQQIEVLSQNHERDVDRKDAIIQMLDKDVDEAEEQHQMALQSHLRQTDALLEIQDARLLAHENEFEKDLATLEDEFNAELENIQKQHQRSKAELMALMKALEERERGSEVKAKQDHDTLKEEIKNKNLEENQMLRVTLDNVIDELEKHFEGAHQNYLQSTDQRTQDYRYLTRSDQARLESSKEIKANIRRIERLQSARTQWQAKISQNKRECEERNKALASERDSIMAHFGKLKAKMSRLRDLQCKRLVSLSNMASQAKSELEKRKGLAERILKLAELARKYETEREKVLPLQDMHAVEVEEKEADLVESELLADAPTKPAATATGRAPLALEHATSAFTQAGQPVAGWDYLQRFHMRLNKALMDRAALTKERERLQGENGDLQRILKQCLDGMAVPADALEGPNPLLVVNGKVNLNVAPARRLGPPTVVEANAAVAAMRHVV